MKQKNIFLDFIFPITVILIPSSRAFYKYLPSLNTIAFLLYGLIFFISLYLLFSKGKFIRILNFFNDRKIVLLSIFLITGITLIMYPIADSLKYQMRGSDQDDCIINGVKFMMSFSNPYKESSYFGNSCSSGLGALFLYVPFVMTGTYPLGSIFASISAIITIKKVSVTKHQATIFALLIFSSIIWIELLFTGSDFNLIGCFLLILAYGISRNVLNKNYKHLIYLSILGGLLASTRLNFLIITPLISLFIFKYWRKGAFVFFLISLIVSVLPSTFIYSLNPDSFAPFHLIDKSSNLLRGGLRELNILSSLIALFIGYKISKFSPEKIPKAIFISLTPSLMILSIGELIFFRQGSLAMWEGANYFIPVLPLAASIISLNFNNKLVKEKVNY